jgi:hypothetical protein
MAKAKTNNKKLEQHEFELACETAKMGEKQILQDENEEVSITPLEGKQILGFLNCLTIEGKTKFRELTFDSQKESAAYFITE